MWTTESLEDYDVLGACLQNIVDSFGSFTLLASGMLIDEGLGMDDGHGLVRFDPKGWYSLPRFLGAFDRINREFGNYTMRQVGLAVPKNSPFPPSITDIHSAIQSLDIAYHMNHGRKGKALFSPESGMQEGIGHYYYDPVPGKREIICRCDNPYPCVFDEGLINAVAQRFEPTATVKHDTSKGCRAHGGETCSYVITWK